MTTTDSMFEFKTDLCRGQKAWEKRHSEEKRFRGKETENKRPKDTTIKNIFEFKRDLCRERETYLPHVQAWFSW